jgi:hypothetical protein
MKPDSICKHCRKPIGKHNAITQACPINPKRYGAFWSYSTTTIFEPRKSKQFQCTECGGDATIGMSNFRHVASGRQIIGKDERLCFQCGKKRGIESPFHLNKKEAK